MKKILVTGSAGQLGQVIVNRLKQKKYEVLGIDLITSPTTDRIVDIRNADEVNKISIGCDAMIHTAAIHGKHYNQKYPRLEFLKTNVDGTFNLLQACVLNKVTKFLYASSTSIYGNAMCNNEQAVWVDETLTPVPRDIYDITKLTAELLCKDYFEKEGIEATILRISRFLPEEENIRAIHRLYRGIDVQDGANGLILALEKTFDTFEIFNISSRSPFTKSDLKALVKDPVATIKKYYPQVEETFERRNWVLPTKIDRVYSIEKARKKLNFHPVYNFIDLIEPF